MESIFRPDLFEGQTVLITGGGTGIGRAIARELVDLGARVRLAARREEPLQATCAELGERASYQLADIRDEAQVASLFAEGPPWSTMRAGSSSARLRPSRPKAGGP
ncbi:MAG: hypothetical protein AMXMBFR33_22110 [Candidatus Xenobia bacterium]